MKAINAEEKIPSKKKMLIFNSIYLVLFLIIFLMTMFNLHRINLFNSIYNLNHFLRIFLNGLYIVLLIVYFGYVLFIFSYLIYTYIKKTEVNKTIMNIYMKLDLVAFTIKVCVIIYFILLLIVTPCSIQGKSMYPTYNSGNHVLCFNNFNQTPKKDQIIVFCAEKNMFYIKRVKAIENDIITYDPVTLELFVNDIFVWNVSESEYKKILNSINIFDYTMYSFTVPKNKIFVLGDNRGNSEDSRELGLIDKSKVFGIVFSNKKDPNNN